MKVKCDHRSKFFQFKQLESRSLKKIRASTGFEPMTFAIPVRCSTNWAMKPHIESKVNKLTFLPMFGFIAQLVEHRTGIAEVMGSNPVEALIFFRLLLSNCLNWKNLLRWSHFTFIFCYYNKGLKEPTVSKFPSARFKAFVNDRLVTKSTLLGVGNGYSSLHQR